MTAPSEVGTGTPPEAEPRSSLMLHLDRQREAATMALANRPGVSLATMTDEEFEAGIAKLKTVQRRVQRLLKEVLIPDVHYGNPKDRNGRPVFQHPMLYQAGAEELRRLLRFQVRVLGQPDVVMDDSFVSVTVVVGVFSSTGELLCQKLANANSLERAYERRDRKGFVYSDPREVLHACMTKAVKRASSLATREAAGATGFFAAEEELADALEQETDPLDQPADKADQDVLITRARDLGVKTKPQLLELIREAVGPERYAQCGGTFSKRDVGETVALIEQKKRAREQDLATDPHAP